MRTTRERGLSYVEILAAMALSTILLVVAVPRLVVPETLRARVSAREIAADLRMAQRLSIAHRADFIVEFSPPAGPYTAYTVRPVTGGPEPDFPKALEAGLVVSGPAQFVFQPDGNATTSGTVTVTAGTATATIGVIGATGRVTVSGP